MTTNASVKFLNEPGGIVNSTTIEAIAIRKSPESGYSFVATDPILQTAVGALTTTRFQTATLCFIICL
jgi:hypothetical protein